MTVGVVAHATVRVLKGIISWFSRETVGRRYLIPETLRLTQHQGADTGYVIRLALACVVTITLSIYTEHGLLRPLHDKPRVANIS